MMKLCFLVVDIKLGFIRLKRKEDRTRLRIEVKIWKEIEDCRSILTTIIYGLEPIMSTYLSSITNY